MASGARPSQDDSSSVPYRLEYAVSVWKQLMALAPEEIALIGRELERLAAEASALSTGSSGRSALDLNDLVVSYEISASRKVLTLLCVERRAVTPA